MSDSHVSQLIEKQMRNWELARAQKLEDVPEEKRPEVQDFVSVSRMVGIDGRQVASELGEQLGWPVFDRSILDEMAGDSFDRKVIYSSMDERDLTWSEDLMLGFFETKFFKRHFRVATDDPARYDVTLNMESFTAAQAAELILKGREIRA